jgi:hypothetical protein
VQRTRGRVGPTWLPIVIGAVFLLLVSCGARLFAIAARVRVRGSTWSPRSWFASSPSPASSSSPRHRRDRPLGPPPGRAQRDLSWLGDYADSGIARPPPLGRV